MSISPFYTGDRDSGLTRQHDPDWDLDKGWQPYKNGKAPIYMSATWVLLSSPGSGCKSNMWTHIIGRTQISKILTSKGVLGFVSSALPRWPELTDYFICVFKKKYFMITNNKSKVIYLSKLTSKVIVVEIGTRLYIGRRKEWWHISPVLLCAGSSCVQPAHVYQGMHLAQHLYYLCTFLVLFRTLQSRLSRLLTSAALYCGLVVISTK